MRDLLLAAFFEADLPRKREVIRKRYASKLLRDGLDSLENPLVRLRFAEKPLASFHWEVEFPEVFDRKGSGFDAIIGNPPFAGKDAVTKGNRPGYLAWLKTIHPRSHRNADLADHFVRRAYTLLRDGGNVGLVATNTIGQGDTRSTGLRWICKRGGVIYDATRRMSWPGQAAVVVSVVHIAKDADLTVSGDEMRATASDSGWISGESSVQPRFSPEQAHASGIASRSPTQVSLGCRCGWIASNA